MNRCAEVRKLLGMSEKELIAKSKGHLVVTKTLEELYEFLAKRMVAEFERAAGQKERKAFITPVGPLQPYANMARMINRKQIPLKNCVFFFMDEYCDDKDRLIPADHPLSFRGKIGKIFFDLIDSGLRPAAKNIIFPTPQNLAKIPGMIEDAGGIEVCYGGIGIHGHVAFNEPEKGVRDTDPRIVTVNDFTRTLDSVRGGSGGNLVNFPRRAVTLGMRQILGARKLLLMTRNEIPGLDWANTVLRIAALGAPGDDYPVTHIRKHPDYIVATDSGAAKAPKLVY